MSSPCVTMFIGQTLTTNPHLINFKLLTFTICAISQKEDAEKKRIKFTKLATCPDCAPAAMMKIEE